MRPSSRVILVMPLAPGIRPSVTSGRPSWIFGLSTAIRWWPINATSQPPPSALPLRQLTTGRPSVSSWRKLFFVCSMSWNTRLASPASRRIVAFRSAPAKKVLLAEARIRPRSPARSACTLWARAAMSCCQAWHMVLTAESGSSKVMVAMPSWIS